MGIDVIDILRLESGVKNGPAHHIRACVGIRNDHIRGIAVGGESGKFANNFRSTLFCVFFAFQNQDTCPFGNHKSIAVAIKRTACFFRGIVVIFRERLHRIETERLFPGYFFRATDHHNIIFSRTDQTGPGNDRHRSAGTGTTDIVTFTLDPIDQRKIGYG